MDYDTTSLGAGVSRGLDDFAKIQDQHKQEARQFDSLVNYLDAAGLMTKAEAKVKSLPELTGIAQGMAVRGAMQKQKYELANLADLADQKQRQVPFMAELAQYGKAPGDQPFDVPFSAEELDRRTQPADLSALMEAGAKTGYRPQLNQVDDMVRAVNMGRQKPAVQLPPGMVPTRANVDGVTYENPPAPLPLGFKPTKVTRDGTTYEDPDAEVATPKSWTSPNGKQFVLWHGNLVPDDPKMPKEDLPEVPGHTWAPDPKTGWKLVATPSSVLTPSQQANEKARLNKSIDALEKEHETASAARKRVIASRLNEYHAQLEELATGPAVPSAPSKAGMMRGASKTVIQNGNRYQTNPDGSSQYLGPAK